MGQMTFNFETEDNEPEETQVEEIKVGKKESKVNDEKDLEHICTTISERTDWRKDVNDNNLIKQ